jgi:hypothetical protein
MTEEAGDREPAARPIRVLSRSLGALYGEAMQSRDDEPRDPRGPDELVWSDRPSRGDGGGDLVDIGGRTRAWPWQGARGTTTGLALAALVAGLLIGFAGGHHLASNAKRHPDRVRTSIPASLRRPGATAAIFNTGNQCAVQQGKTLQLGIEVENRSGRTIIVDRLDSVVRSDALRQIGAQLATCGSVRIPGGAPLRTIANDTTAWFTLTFAVKVRCPARYSVLFIMGYASSGMLTSTSSMYFDGFPDLSNVPYSGCRKPV